MTDERERELEAVDALLAKHLPQPPSPDPPWVREFDGLSATPALFEALMLRQRMLETLLQAEPAPAPVALPIQVGASRSRCPFCHEEVRAEARDWVACRECLARHHAACWQESTKCATCGAKGYLPAVARPVVPGWVRWAAAAAALFLLAAGGVAQLRTSRFHEAQEALLAQAAEAARPLDEREKLVERVLRLDPENARARALGALIAHERELGFLAAHDLEVEREARSKDRERFEQDAKDREAAHAQKAQEALEARRKLAEDLLAQAKAADELGAEVPLLVRAAAVAPEDAKELREKIEKRRYGVELKLAELAVGEKATSMAAYWLKDIEGFAPARALGHDFLAVRTSLERVTSGLALVDEARAFAAKDQLIEARERFEIALGRGVGRDVIAADVADVRTRCEARASELVSQARRLLEEHKLAESVRRVQEAKRYDASSQEAILIRAELDARIGTEARRDAAALALKDGEGRKALEVLESAAALVDDKALADSLRRERSLRGRLLASAERLSGLVFVPERGETREERAFYIQRDLVTNEDFQAFVNDGGYDRSELWDRDAQRLVAQGAFAPEGASGSRGSPPRNSPRAWKGGTYGGAAEAKKPVRGITVFEARAYARWISERQGGRWRLPSAAEWEMAAGFDPASGMVRAYPWGSSFETGSIATEKEAPAVVGENAAATSALGLRDASGLVRQWCEKSPEPSGGSYREHDHRMTSDALLKGSSFATKSDKASLLARVRHHERAERDPKTDALLEVGFRLVRECD